MIWYSIIEHAEEWLNMDATEKGILSIEEKIDIILSHSRDNKNDMLKHLQKYVKSLTEIKDSMELMTNNKDNLYLILSEIKGNSNKL